MTDEYHTITTGLEYCDNDIDRHTRLIEDDEADMIILTEELTHYEIGQAHKETREQMKLLELNIQIHKNKIKLIEIMKLVYMEMNLMYTSTDNILIKWYTHGHLVIYYHKQLYLIRLY